MNLHKYIGTSLAAILVLAQTACLKDNSNNANPSSGSNNVVEFQNTAVPKSYTSPFAEYDNGVPIDPTADTGSFRVNINYTGAVTVAPVDITVNLALSQAALDSFNNAVGTSYEIPPADVFSFPASVVIPKGTRQIMVRPIITAAADYDYTKTYALPLTITSSSYGVVSSNYGTAIYQFIAENKYDGAYSFTEELVGWGAYGIADGPPSYTWGNNVDIVTTGQFSDMTFDPGGEGNLQLAFGPTGSATAFGATTPQFTFDPATDALISVVNTTPDDGRHRALMLNPAVTDSRYDPSTKTIYAAYIMTQGTARPPQYVYDTLVYQGPR